MKNLKNPQESLLKLVTIGIPAYKAEDTICDTLASIYMQTIRD